MSVFFWKSPDEELIRNLMDKYAVSLDDDYIQFLKKYNGIFVDGDGDYIDIKLDKVENEFISFQALFGLNNPRRNFDLFQLNDELRQEIESLSHPLVIGEDPGGNFYVLENTPESKKVFYWDRTHLHCNANADKPDIAEHGEEGNYYMVSENFGEFWKLLSSYTDQMKFVQAQH